MAIFIAFFAAFLLSSACSLDAFAAAFAYGAKGIRIPFWSNQIINGICSLIFGLSLWVGSFAGDKLPGRLTAVAAFGILFFIGMTKLMDSVTKSLIRRYNSRNQENFNKELKFSLLNFSFILNLYANPEDADVNANKVISAPEAAALAVSLSLDGIAVGFGAALGSVSIWMVIAISLLTNMLAIYLGGTLGHKLSRKLPFNISWVSGLILIGLAFAKAL